MIASQTCDLARNPTAEPEVECLRAFWTDNEKIIVPAGINSGRFFLLRERATEKGREGLIADATARVLVTKESLLRFNGELGCGNRENERRFRDWLGRRFSRVAVPAAHVEAIQRPIVEALRVEETSQSVLPLLRGVAEVLFAVANEPPPFRVHLLFVAEEGLSESEPLSGSDAEELAGWFGEALAAAGQAELEHWDLVTTDKISLRDYHSFTSLALDEFSLEG